MQRIVLLLLGFGHVLALELCNMTECNGKKHLGCDNDLTFHSSCLRRHVLVNMQIYQEYLVKIHNKYRNDVAAGIIPGVAPAQHMPEMLWHSKLALLAQYHVKRCLQSLTDYCVALPNFTQPAVNYGLDWLNIETRINYRTKMDSNKMTVQVDQWMQQVYKLAHIAQYANAISDIVNIVNEKNFYLGCAAAEDYDKKNSRFVLICYYDERFDWRKLIIYEKGTFEPTKCPRGPSDNYAHLCKPYKDVED